MLDHFVLLKQKRLLGKSVCVCVGGGGCSPQPPGSAARAPGRAPYGGLGRIPRKLEEGYYFLDRLYTNMQLVAR